MAGQGELRTSVVIPCRNAAATLGAQLEALCRQKPAPATASLPKRAVPEFEVLVAENGSTDHIQEVVESFGDRVPGLRIVEATQRLGAAFARNRGAESASGEILLFCDADDQVAGDWVAAMTRAVELSGFVASRFDIKGLNAPEVRRHLPTHQQETGLGQYTYPSFLPHAGGGGLGIWKSWHEESGGFDESMAALEDTDYCWRLQIAGHPLVFAPEAVVSIRVPATLRSAWRQAVSYGRHNVLIYKRYRTRGMPRLAPQLGLFKTGALLLRSWQLVSTRRRWLWIWQAGWRWGRVQGCWQEKVWAL